MVVTLIRTLIIFTTLVIVMRLMGKRQIGEMQPYEFIVTLIIADLACIPMADVSIPLIYGIVSILGLFIFHQVLSLLEQGGTFFKKVISGKPSIVINKNGVDLNELKRNNMGVEDLIESMRAQGYFSLDDLDYAIFESNGKLSALEKTDENSQNAIKTSSIPLLIVSDGRLEKNNLPKIKVTESEFYSYLKSRQLSLKDVEVLTVDGNGKTYLKKKKERYTVTAFPFIKEPLW